MFPLYDLAIAPVLQAAGAKRVVEIGALRGETTVLLLELLGADGELHVIDPVPLFDPEEHAQQFPGRYHFHRGTSHDVLPRLAPTDAALIDGDHNWYTVHRELEILASVAEAAGAPLPVLILHDVGWPYGRRDLYYAPERIPPEHRQPYAQRGMVPGRPGLVKRGGLNPTHYNARREGGPRNGVMTALDDFIAAHDRPVRRVVLPIYFGLAIVVEEERLERQPELAAVLDRLEGADGRHDLLELGEALRLKELAGHHRFVFAAQDRADRAADRYLEVVKRALLDEHHLENEVRIEYLGDCIKRGQDPDPLKLRDPASWMKKEVQRLRDSRRTGTPIRDLVDRPMFPYTTMGHSGLDRLRACLETIRTEAIDGDLAACGVWRGGSAIFLRAFLDAYEIGRPEVWVADSFRGAPEPDDGEDAGVDARERPFVVADLNIVREGFARFDLLDDRVRFLQGPFDDTLPSAPIERLALLHVDAESRQATAAVLDHLYDKVVVGGFVVIEHFDAPGCRQAVEEFRARRGITDALERVDAAGAVWRRSAPAAAPPAETAAQPVRPARHAPLAPRRAQDEIDLSVVVVFYNMRREANRTLHSLSRSYQRGIDDLDYEVVVIENGSDDDQRLGEELVRSFGPEFRYVDLGPEAAPSPVTALNRGIAMTRGRSLALMIDGAHVLTPGVLHFGTLGLRTYEPAVVTTHQWYVGPGQQGDAMEVGYDQEYEDRLFDEVGWPADGYRLFDIGHFIGERDWFDGLWESNCIFTPRALVEQVGGFDESFAMAGGGYANLDLFERLGATPGVTVVNMLGEGSFHQLHGGTTTNQPDIGERHSRLMSYREHYEELRQRPFRGPGKNFHFVGSMFESARRTRARRMTATAFRNAQPSADGVPAKAAPIPDDLRSEFTEAFWRSLAWRDTTWLGRRVKRAPTDLIAYQELISELRPDWIVETRTEDGGRAFFLATICELLGHGQVLSVHARSRGQLPEHPRITYVSGEPAADATVEEVRRAVGEGANTLVVIGARRRALVVDEFEAYAPLVPVGSYVIIEETILNGHPVRPEHGPGPAEAVTLLLKRRRDFAPDPRMERYGLTFNPRGFLKRVE